MKKIIALALVLVFTIALAVPAFAENISLSGSDNGTSLSGASNNTAKVTYNVDGAYTVSVPATLVANGDSQEVSATGVMLYKGTKLTVTVTYDTLKVDEDEGTSLDYDIKKGDAVIDKNGGEIFSIEAGGETTKAQAIQAKVTGTAIFAGDYTDTITFAVVIGQINNG